MLSAQVAAALVKPERQGYLHSRGEDERQRRRPSWLQFGLFASAEPRTNSSSSREKIWLEVADYFGVPEEFEGVQASLSLT